MKTIKFRMAIVAILLFSNLIFAENPLTIDNVDDFANKRIAGIGADIVLTDSQKVILLASSKTFALKIQNSHSLSNVEQKKAFSKAFQEYRANIDSVLSKAQKSQLTAKQKERRNIAISELKLNK
ncbi:MAG: hypothetical protein Q8904_01725 [Bacteroidota bacterium]|nr:hypothetical protein [Bacteroidota bacterium]